MGALLHQAKCTAINALMASSFPSASVLFSDAAPCSQLSSSLSHAAAEAPLGELLLTQQLLHGRRGGGEAGPSPISSSEGLIQLRALTTFPFKSDHEDAHALWRSLYEHWGPPLGGRGTETPGAYPLCSSLILPNSVLPLPLWCPDAVAFIGGYEPPDLRRVVLPQLMENIPRLSDVPLFSGDTSLSSEEPHPDGGPATAGRRAPCYQRQRYLQQHAMADKGCKIHGSGLLELSLPVFPPLPNGLQRVRTMMTVANPSVTVAQLHRESGAARRTHLRHSFGYSLAVLHEALPLPLSVAVSVLRVWERELVKKEPTSSAWWVSVLGHLIRTKPSELRSDRLNPSEAPGASANTHWTQSSAHVTEALLLAQDLAHSALREVSTCSDEDWTSLYMQNFFLPVESFASCPDVLELSARRRQLPIDSIGSVAMKYYEKALDVIIKRS